MRVIDRQRRGDGIEQTREISLAKGKKKTPKNDLARLLSGLLNGVGKKRVAAVKAYAEFFFS